MLHDTPLDQGTKIFIAKGLKNSTYFSRQFFSVDSTKMWNAVATCFKNISWPLRYSPSFCNVKELQIRKHGLSISSQPYGTSSLWVWCNTANFLTKHEAQAHLKEVKWDWKKSSNNVWKPATQLKKQRRFGWVHYQTCVVTLIFRRTKAILSQRRNVRKCKIRCITTNLTNYCGECKDMPFMYVWWI
jgi:hypothetical protein